jgi:hypothetical protein
MDALFCQKRYSCTRCIYLYIHKIMYTICNEQRAQRPQPINLLTRRRFHVYINGPTILSPGLYSFYGPRPRPSADANQKGFSCRRERKRHRTSKRTAHKEVRTALIFGEVFHFIRYRVFFL